MTFLKKKRGGFIHSKHKHSLFVNKNVYKANRAEVKLFASVPFLSDESLYNNKFYNYIIIGNHTMEGFGYRK